MSHKNKQIYKFSKRIRIWINDFTTKNVYSVYIVNNIYVYMKKYQYKNNTQLKIK